MAVVVVWLIVTAVCQWEIPFCDKIRSHDRWGLIPRWTFFAPIPGTSDYHLLYRDSTAEQAPGPWVEIPFVCTREPWHVVWNPLRRRGKLLSDCVNQLARDLEWAKGRGLYDAYAAQLAVTFPYLVILNNVVRDSAETEEAHVTSRQFVVVEAKHSRAQAEVAVILASPFHRLRRVPEVAHS